MEHWFRYISYYFLLILVHSATACSDELQAPVSGGAEEGLPATLTVSVGLLDRALISRADVRGEVPENLVTSIWIGVFNETTGEIKGRYAIDEINDDGPEGRWRPISIETTSGRTRVVGVANYMHRFAVVPKDGEIVLIPLGEALAAVKTFDEFKAMAVTFNERAEISTDQPLNAMLMCGHYSEDFGQDVLHPHYVPRESTFIITPGTFTAKGCIHLRRLISQNKFNIEFNSNNIGSFKILEWQVHNLPNSSWLRERFDGDDSPNSGQTYAIEGLSVTDSDVYNVVETNGNKVTFDFWQIENLHTGLEPPAGEFIDGSYYSYRDREHKIGGINSGKFSSLVPAADSDDYNNNATYVRFVAELSMKTDENGNRLPPGVTNRVVKAQYIVHMGYCENKDMPARRARDFNCRRNAKYIYNLTINNIGSMMAEVNREGEPTPSLEGDITDSTENAVSLDCHYNVANVYFTRAELDDFQFAIEAPGPDRSRNVMINQNNVPGAGDNDNFRFYSWVELRKTTGENVIADYKPHDGGDGKTYYLHEMNSSREAGWYTLFIGENAYERFSGEGAIDEADKYNWHWYCDRTDRRLWLNLEAMPSADGKTVYYRSKYAFSQKSIQTYYDKNQRIKALGVEHLNESLGVNIRNTWNNGKNLSRTGAGYEGTSGRYNLGQYLMGVSASSAAVSNWRDDISWSRIVDVNRFLRLNAIDNQNLKLAARTEHVPAYNYGGNTNYIAQDGNGGHYIWYDTRYDVDNSANASYAEMVTACMNRNRDLDGDGYIDRNEIRWFVPSELQMLRIILGRQALTTPVMDYMSIRGRINSNNAYNSRYLVACANGRILWAMEGLSTSAWEPNWADVVQSPWNIRCVRYMGSDISYFNNITSVDPPYTQDPTDRCIVKLDHMDNRAVRVEAYRESENFMPPHVLNDQTYNRCFYKFEIHPDEIVILDSRMPGLDNGLVELANYLANYNPCEKLRDKKGKDGWRVPNQKELSILATFTKDDGTTYFYDNEGSGAGYLISCTFSYFDKNGTPLGGSTATTAELAGHYNLKVLTSNGGGTQGDDFMVPYASYGVRCVRDVP